MPARGCQDGPRGHIRMKSGPQEEGSTGRMTSLPTYESSSSSRRLLRGTSWYCIPLVYPFGIGHGGQLHSDWISGSIAVKDGRREVAFGTARNGSNCTSERTGGQGALAVLVRKSYSRRLPRVTRPGAAGALVQAGSASVDRFSGPCALMESKWKCLVGPRRWVASGNNPMSVRRSPNSRVRVRTCPESLERGRKRAPRWGSMRVN